MEFFIHPCKFFNYSISFSFNKIKFLQSPKIHDYSLTNTRDSPALEVHSKAAPRWLTQRSLSHQSRRAYLKPRTLGGNKANMAKQQEKSIISQALRHPISHYQPLRPTVQASSGPRQVPTDRLSTQLLLHVNCQCIHNQSSTSATRHVIISFNI